MVNTHISPTKAVFSRLPSDLQTSQTSHGLHSGLSLGLGGQPKRFATCDVHRGLRVFLPDRFVIHDVPAARARAGAGIGIGPDRHDPSRVTVMVQFRARRRVTRPFSVTVTGSGRASGSTVNSTRSLSGIISETGRRGTEPSRQPAYQRLGIQPAPSSGRGTQSLVTGSWSWTLSIPVGVQNTL